MVGWGDYNPNNDAADQIVEDPSRFLISQEELFEAEGGWATFGLTMGLASAGAAAVILGRPGMAAHFGRGQLKALDWAMVGGASWFGGFIGTQMGHHTLGDAQRVNNHWMAYLYVKTQNRYIPGSTLKVTPMFY